VRKAWKCEGSRLSISKDSQISEDYITYSMLDGFFLEKTCEIKLHSLNIYGPGGFFKPHLDNVHSRGQIATLVYTLPSTFTGGDLVIYHHDLHITINPYSESSCKVTKDEETYPANIVLFYSSCFHEIQ